MSFTVVTVTNLAPYLKPLAEITCDLAGMAAAPASSQLLSIAEPEGFVGVMTSRSLSLPGHFDVEVLRRHAVDEGRVGDGDRFDLGVLREDGWPNSWSPPIRSVASAIPP